MKLLEPVKHVTYQRWNTMNKYSYKLTIAAIRINCDAITYDLPYKWCTYEVTNNYYKT